MAGSATTLQPEETQCTWSDLPRYANGEEIQYSVKETVVPEGYTSSTDSQNAAVENGTATITNTHEPQVTTVTAAKVWANMDAKGASRAAYELSLYANGLKVDSVSMAADDANVTWSNLPMFYKGKLIEYSVKETVVPEGFVSSTSIESARVDADGVATITNTYKPHNGGKDNDSDKDHKNGGV